MRENISEYIFKKLSLPEGGDKPEYYKDSQVDGENVLKNPGDDFISTLGHCEVRTEAIDRRQTGGGLNSD